jgi:hypothetical protein
MTQAQGSYGRLVLNEELTFKSAPELVLEDCEDAWDEQVVGNVTPTLDAADFKVGSGSAKLDIAAGASVGVLASEVIAIASLALYTHIALWIKSSVALDAGDLQLLLDETADCASPLETIDIPALSADTWTQIRIALANPSTDLVLISIGLKMVVDKGAFIVHLDDIRAITEGRFMPFLTESLRLTRDLTSSNIIRSTRNPNKPTRRAYSLAGDITTELNPYMGLLLKHLMGGYERTGGGPYTHTFTIGSLPAGLQVEKQFTDIVQYLRYNGCKVNSLKIEVKEEGEIAATFSLAGAKEAAASPAQPFDPDPTDYGHNPFDAYEAVINQGGNPIANCTLNNFTLSNEHDLAAARPIGSQGELASLPAGIAKVDGQITVLFEDMTLYDLALAGTETSLSIVLAKGDGGGTLGNEKCTFSIEELVFKPQSPLITGPKGVLAELPFVAYYDNGASASALKIVLINSEPNL